MIQAGSILQGNASHYIQNNFFAQKYVEFCYLNVLLYTCYTTVHNNELPVYYPKSKYIIRNTFKYNAVQYSSATN